MKNLYWTVMYYTLNTLQDVANDAPNERTTDDMNIMIFSVLSHVFL